MENMVRANKVTAYWEGEGIAVGVFYKTHTKLATLRSNDEQVIGAGFTMPEGTDEAPVTAAQKLEAFKNFICANASRFTTEINGETVGITYDPVDRRDETYKFPSRYDEVSLQEYAKKMATIAIEKVLGSVQSNVVDRMIKGGNLPEGTIVQYGMGEGVVDVTEKYANGFIKYATVNYPVAIAIAGKQVDTNMVVELVSGQIKKPRAIGETVLTMTGVKELLTNGGALPVVEKKSKKDEEAADADAATPAEAPAEA